MSPESFAGVEVFGSKPSRALQASRLFMTLIAPGHTQGFTGHCEISTCNIKGDRRAMRAVHDGWDVVSHRPCIGTLACCPTCPLLFIGNMAVNVTSFFAQPRASVSTTAP